MIEIPEKGLRIEFCRHYFEKLSDLRVNHKICFLISKRDNICPEDGLLCDVKAYRTVREKI